MNVKWQFCEKRCYCVTSPDSSIRSVATEKRSLTYEGNRGQGVECMLCQATISPAAGPPRDRRRGPWCRCQTRRLRWLHACGVVGVSKSLNRRSVAGRWLLPQNDLLIQGDGGDDLPVLTQLGSLLLWSRQGRGGLGSGYHPPLAVHRAAPVEVRAAVAGLSEGVGLLEQVASFATERRAVAFVAHQLFFYSPCLGFSYLLTWLPASRRHCGGGCDRGCHCGLVVMSCWDFLVFELAEFCHLGALWRVFIAWWDQCWGLCQRFHRTPVVVLVLGVGCQQALWARPASWSWYTTPAP